MKKTENLHGVECLKKYVGKKEWEEFQKCFTEIVGQMQDNAFMEGYAYAIAILEESMVKKQTETQESPEETTDNR